MIWKINAVPTIALVFDPHRFAAIIFCCISLVVGNRDLNVAVLLLMAFRGIKISMYSLVRQVNKKRPVGITLFCQPVQCVVSQFVCDIALLFDVLAVDIKSAHTTMAFALRIVISLTCKAQPMIEAGLRIILVSTHMPLAKKCSFITGLLQIAGKINCTCLGWLIVIDHPVTVHILAGQY